MEKINFEDATLKKSAYVTINGTEYPVTDTEYVGGTDLDAATLTIAQIPSHAHSINGKQTAGNPSLGGKMAVAGGAGSWATNPLNTNENGSGKPHNNLQPYITCYMFKRTA